MPPSPSTGSATGKIILSGEYAVLFGHRGIAVPSKEKVEVTWEDHPSMHGVKVVWEESSVHEAWIAYVESILELLKGQTAELKGTLTIKNTIPLGKGMGSSTAIIIAICRCLLGEHSAKSALIVEDTLNPSHSGLDFAVIREERPLVYQQGKLPMPVTLPPNILKFAELIDTGMPNESTKDLIAWMKSRDPAEIQGAIDAIGECTERIVKGEDLHAVMRDHHKAQVALGVVPESAQKVIAEIEKAGGTAKVIGAGGRTGGGGMVLKLA